MKVEAEEVMSEETRKAIESFQKTGSWIRFFHFFLFVVVPGAALMSAAQAVIESTQ